MNAATFTTLVRVIGAEHIFALFLVLARVTPLFVVAPVFSSPQLMPRARSVLAVAIAIGLTPIAGHGITVPTNMLAIAGLLVENLIVGFALAYAIACVFAAVQGAGVLADSMAGFSFGSTVDPANGNPGGSLSNFYGIVGMALFLVIGGDAWTMRGLATTFRIVPIDRAPAIPSLVSGAESLFGGVLLGAVEIAAPVMLTIVIADIAFGMVSKVVPQLNVFAVGFPVKVGVALIVTGISLPFMANWMSNQMETSVTSALHALGTA